MIYYDNKEYEDEEFSMYLIIKYMNKYFNKEQIRSIKSAYEPNDIAVLIGEKDFSFFCLYFLRDYFVASDNNDNRNLAPVHLEIWDELTNMFTYDKYDREEFILPRGCAKSTVADKALSCWQHVYKKSRFTIVMGNKESDATQFISGTRHMLSNPRVTSSFGNLIDTKERIVNRQEIELTNDTKIQAYSWGSSVRGTTYSCSEGEYRPSIILLDDILSEDDILSDNAKEKVIGKFIKEVLEVGDKAVYRKGKKIKPASKFIVLGTPLAVGDFVLTIKDDPTFRVFHRSVCDFNVDDYFTKNRYWKRFKNILFSSGKDAEDRAKEYYIEHKEQMDFPTIWEKYNCYDMAITYFTKRIAFMQELQCDCENIGDTWINTLITAPREEIEQNEFDTTIMSIDQNASNNRHSDYTAITIGSRAGFLYYVRKGDLRRFDSKTEFNLYIGTIINYLKQYEDITHIVLEKNVYKGIDATRIEEEIKNDESLRKRNIQVITIYNNRNKDDRISTITDKINNGQIIFPQEDKKYWQQVKNFKGAKYSKNDDAIDSLEMLINNIDKVKKTNKITFLKKSCLF